MNVTQFNKMIKTVNAKLKELDYDFKSSKIKFGLQGNSNNDNPKKILVEVDSAEAVISFLNYYRILNNNTVKDIDKLYYENKLHLDGNKIWLSLEVD